MGMESIALALRGDLAHILTNDPEMDIQEIGTENGLEFHWEGCWAHRNVTISIDEHDDGIHVLLAWKTEKSSTSMFGLVQDIDMESDDIVDCSEGLELAA